MMEPANDVPNTYDALVSECSQAPRSHAGVCALVSAGLVHLFGRRRPAGATLICDGRWSAGAERTIPPSHPPIASPFNTSHQPGRAARAMSFLATPDTFVAKWRSPTRLAMPNSDPTRRRVRECVPTRPSAARAGPTCGERHVVQDYWRALAEIIRARRQQSAIVSRDRLAHLFRNARAFRLLEAGELLIEELTP